MELDAKLKVTGATESHKNNFCTVSVRCGFPYTASGVGMSPTCLSNVAISQ